MATSGKCTGRWPAQNPGRAVRRLSQDTMVALTVAMEGTEQERRFQGHLRDESTGLSDGVRYG